MGKMNTIRIVHVELNEFIIIIYATRTTQGHNTLLKSGTFPMNTDHGRTAFSASPANRILSENRIKHPVAFPFNHKS